MFTVVKRHKRLWIDDLGSAEGIYTPPNFVKLQSRDQLKELAAKFNELGRRCINAIADFEARHSSRKVRKWAI